MLQRPGVYKSNQRPKRRGREGEGKGERKRGEKGRGKEEGWERGI